MVQIVGIAIVGVMLALFLKQYEPTVSTVVVVATGVLLFFLCFDGLQSLMDFIQNMSKTLGKNQVYLRLLCKLIGIAYISEFTSGICKDAGYQSLSCQVELAGKLAILVCALPVLKSMLQVVEQIVDMRMQ